MEDTLMMKHRSLIRMILLVALLTGLTYSPVWGIPNAGSLVAWGETSVPPAGNNFVAIAASEGNSLALKSDGSLAGWGYNSDGETNVPSGHDFVAIAAGQLHSLALKSDGSLVAWGSNRYSATDVPAGHDFVAIAAGGNHSLALKSDGS